MAAGDTQEHDIVIRYDLPEVVVVAADTYTLYSMVVYDDPPELVLIEADTYA